MSIILRDRDGRELVCGARRALGLPVRAKIREFCDKVAFTLRDAENRHSRDLRDLDRAQPRGGTGGALRAYPERHGRAARGVVKYAGAPFRTRDCGIADARFDPHGACGQARDLARRSSTGRGGQRARGIWLEHGAAGRGARRAGGATSRTSRTSIPHARGRAKDQGPPCRVAGAVGVRSRSKRPPPSRCPPLLHGREGRLPAMQNASPAGRGATDEARPHGHIAPAFPSQISRRAREAGLSLRHHPRVTPLALATKSTRCGT